jgi:hypothetical protein
MDSIAAASVQRSTIQLQQAVQLDMMKKATSSEQDMAARLLASAQVVSTAPANPPGIGQLVDLRA